MARPRLDGVRQLSSGRWQVRYTGPDGSRRAARHTYATRTEARRALSLIDAEIARGAWVDRRLAAERFDRYAHRWLQERPRLSARTVELYQGLLRRHLLPHLGSIRLEDITTQVVRSWRLTLLAEDVGQSTVAKAYRLLRAILNTAVDDGILARNPCRLKGAGEERPAERPVLSLEQVFALADAVKPRYRCMVLLAALASLRWGELVGLQRADIDLESATVNVRRTVAEVGATLVIKQTKTTAGRRLVALPRALVQDLAFHLEHYAEADPQGRVFVGEKGASPRRSYWTRQWREAKAQAGVPNAFHFHDLRHTGNHLAAATGASTRELMGRMGHSSMRAALIYQHRTLARDRQIAEDLDNLILAAEMGASGGASASLGT
ncbi:MAG TPA: tyrosine-type recombinase/integrase [Dermatophilaceae bacterium]|nr:tyrosine-type recombinase/integrase [Dermatophilaceae bacterium]